MDALDVVVIPNSIGNLTIVKFVTTPTYTGIRYVEHAQSKKKEGILNSVGTVFNKKRELLP